ncbi:hypothetical protein [Pseudobdellovibrio exovorus]|uniref:Secreted protein n=1 Tax=Pseudobdellovibrio exovorus JSS TaxID=1184267 RepID=M4VF41_9BACT|nr:hypothetical protein [Pseudobdellovibrio exovorus]AGH96666.1 hypothetical protein A11Q_2450 [Pseudobdellovibrio exovorus JSS]
MKFSNRFLLSVFLGIFSLAIFSNAAEPIKTCVRDQKGLRELLGDQNFPAEWIETTADDGKPLMLKMSDRDDRLYFIFDKTREGIWAEGLIEVCSEKDGVVVKISGQDIKLGDKAPRLIRWSMSGGAKFKLKLKEKDKMYVSTLGWSGDFIPMTLPANVNPETAQQK